MINRRNCLGFMEVSTITCIGQGIGSYDIHIFNWVTLCHHILVVSSFDMIVKGIFQPQLDIDSVLSSVGRLRPKIRTLQGQLKMKSNYIYVALS